MADGWAIGAWCDVGEWAIEKLWKTAILVILPAEKLGCQTSIGRGAGFPDSSIAAGLWIAAAGFWWVATGLWPIAAGGWPVIDGR